MPTSSTTNVTTNTTTTTTTITSPNNNSNNNPKAWGTAGAVMIITAVLLWGFYSVFYRMENSTNIVSVSWKNEDSTIVNAGPSWFYYDLVNDSIKTSKPINDQDKKSLLNLVDSSSHLNESYKKAISELAFRSNTNLKNPYLLILLLTSICGAIGVQLRTINNFIGVACFKNEFDFDIWWPWYFLRPLMGCLVGPVIFIIFDGKLMPLSTQFNYSNILVVAISILAGFGAEDVLNTLRSLSKRLFGYKEEK